MRQRTGKLTLHFVVTFTILMTRHKKMHISEATMYFQPMISVENSPLAMRIMMLKNGTAGMTLETSDSNSPTIS